MPKRKLDKLAYGTGVHSILSRAFLSLLEFLSLCSDTCPCKSLIMNSFVNLDLKVKTLANFGTYNRRKRWASVSVEVFLEIRHKKYTVKTEKIITKRLHV